VLYSLFIYFYLTGSPLVFLGAGQPRGLDEMKADGTAAQISEKWFGADIIK